MNTLSKRLSQGLAWLRRNLGDCPAGFWHHRCEYVGEKWFGWERSAGPPNTTDPYRCRCKQCGARWEAGYLPSVAGDGEPVVTWTPVP